jgi:cytochrome P450 family 110
MRPPDAQPIVATGRATASPGLPDGPRFQISPQAWSLISKPRQFYAWLRRRYGEVATLRAASGPLVMVLTAEGARQVLTRDPDSYDAFHKEAFTGMAGSGSLWVLAGARHRRERQLLSPRFTAQRVRRFGTAIQEITRRHTDGWQAGQRVRAYEVMLGISLDVILRVIFGSERGDLIDEGRRALQKLLHAVHPLIFFDPAFHAWWFPPWLKYRRAQREFARFVTRCLGQRRSQGGDHDDVLGVMLAARDGDEPFWSDDHIRDQLATILLSGHETTAVGLSWALYELAHHPDVLARLRDELDALGPEPDPDLIAKQPYLGAVCDETLRRHTILMEISRMTRVPCELMGHALPAGVGVGVGIGAIHQDPSLYPEPDKFRPERFIARQYSAFEFLPFGGGHRRCLGAALSDYEMRIVLATIVTRWQYEITGEEQEPRHNIGTGPKHGVRMRVIGFRSPADRRPTAADQIRGQACV